jgi:uncharacterized OB-fold protein
MDRLIDATAPRLLPSLDDVNRPFWTGGARGELLIQRCVECERWVHPPTSTCGACGGTLRPEPVRGTGTLFTWTVNHQPFHPDVAPPYVVAIVVLDEADDLRLATNLVHVERFLDADGNLDGAHLECGMRVRVLFEPHGDIYVPVFEPTGEE